ncbi:MAG: universal stress protein [Chitinophagales bacterium]
MSILFPTDMGEQSAKTFEFALNLAKKLNENITLIHVYPLPLTYPSLDESRLNDATEELLMATETAMEERLKLFKDELKAMYTSHAPEMVRVNGMLKMGFVGEEVAVAAEEINASYVVIGVKHTGGLKRFLGGSNVSGIIKKSKSPVITVPEKYNIVPIQQIAYATDLTFNDSEVISRMLELAAKFEAQVNCFHVHDSNLEVENAIIDDFIRQYKNEVDQKIISFDLIDNINILDGIDFFVKNKNIDLLVVLKQKTYWLEIFETSITKQLVFHENVPMLVYHE